MLPVTSKSPPEFDDKFVIPVALLVKSIHLTLSVEVEVVTVPLLIILPNTVNPILSDTLVKLSIFKVLPLSTVKFPLICL
jgi:hypothetical protein